MHFQTVTPHSYKWLSYAFGLYNTFYWKRWNSNFAICMYVSLIAIYLLLFDLEYKTAVSHIVNGLGFIYFKITIVLASLPLIRLSPAVLHFPCTKWKKIEKMFLKSFEKAVFTHFKNIVVFAQLISIVISHVHFNLRASFIPFSNVIVQGNQNKNASCTFPACLFWACDKLKSNVKELF